VGETVIHTESYEGWDLVAQVTREQIAKNTFGKCMYSIGEHLFTLVSCYRSSVMLKSMSSGYQELSMVISELRDVRSTAKAFAEAQHTAVKDMLKWSITEENSAIRDTFVQLSELSALWTEVQKEFAGEITSKHVYAHGHTCLQMCSFYSIPV
jgi:hypothetical protein